MVNILIEAFLLMEFVLITKPFENDVIIGDIF
jgi:hypothetical protein